ncbi:MAG TPA: beta-propeller domain-containing protein [Allosphingosinicella sp.]|nr:beta-propeller domain-containing protein [Allosphingosinicella sp.]
MSSEEVRLTGTTRTEDLINHLPQAFASTNITNRQEANVDEGGIVKVLGDFLVILRRGRLFTVSLAAGGLRPIDHIDAFPPGVSASGDWYDEMLVAGDRVIVIGYSYARGGTEINRFRLGPDGGLRWEDSYHLRSNDYYSDRNYASRLIGDRLIIYTPLELYWDDDPLEVLPGIRRWQADASNRRFRPIAGGRQIYKPPTRLRRRDIDVDTLHTIINCDVTAPVLDCSAVGVLGPESRTFYVSGNAVYLWTADEWYDDKDEDEGVLAFLYRLPLAGGRPAAIGVRGAPVDQFSFREDPGLINVVVRAEGEGDAMWGPEVSDGDVALLRLPIRNFGDGSRDARPSRYRPLPSIEGDDWNFHNRFVGRHLLYSAGAFGEATELATLVAVPLDGGPASRLELPHSVGRIEVLGRDGLAVGSAGDALGFSAIELDGRTPRVGDFFRLPEAAEGETRSHAFFFNPETADGASGMLGLPIARAVDPAYHRFFGSAAAMLFLSRNDRRFAHAGELAAEVRGVADDSCQASCIDWYGNARPIFLGDRVFALLGYELVEGRRDGRTIRERRRVNFAPTPATDGD